MDVDTSYYHILSVTPVWIRKYIKPIIEKYEYMAR